MKETLLTGELPAPLDYADSHAKVMSAIADLHIISYDIVFAKDGHVLLRYSAEGSHCGQPHNGIEPSGKKAKWTAAAIFEVTDGKVHSFTKEWDKLSMWKQLGWVCTSSEQNPCCCGPLSESQDISQEQNALNASLICLIARSSALKQGC